MKTLGAGLVAVAVAVLVGMRAPDVKVELKGVHLCCGGCEGAASKALTDGGAKDAKCDKAAGTITFSASNEKNAQKALDSFAKAGFYGDTGNKALMIKDEVVANPKKPVKVTSVVITGIHNCCGGCTKGIKAALAKADGYESDDLADKATKVTVKGNFEAAAVMKALHDGGYNGTLGK
jgi:mercuric ion binding protein